MDSYAEIRRVVVVGGPATLTTPTTTLTLTLMLWGDTRAWMMWLVECSHPERCSLERRTTHRTPINMYWRRKKSGGGAGGAGGRGIRPKPVCMV